MKKNMQEHPEFTAPKNFEFFQNAQNIFFDFDGVIKDTVGIKGEAFFRLFFPFGSSCAEKVREHHLRNGGMTRFEKFPIYFRWAGVTCSDDLVRQYSDEFSSIVIDKVISSPWVPGIEKYLKENFTRQNFFLITATPASEIAYIASMLDITKYFREIRGAPIDKTEAVRKILVDWNLNKKHSVLVGDSTTDIEAAVENNVRPILRRTPENLDLEKNSTCVVIDDFLGGCYDPR